MGALCSKSTHMSGGHVVLGSSSAAPPAPGDPRAAAAEAAERRRKDAQGRGTHTSNPNQGALAAKVEASRNAKRMPEPEREERLVWD